MNAIIGGQETGVPPAVDREARSPEPVTPFSLFDDDLLNRAFGLIGLGHRRGWHVAVRCAIVSTFTWLPMAVAAAAQGLFSTRIEARNFFADYAAYAQFLIALPLFIIAERVVSRSTEDASRDFTGTGVVGSDAAPQLDRFHREAARLRRWWLPELVCILLAYGLAIATFAPEVEGARMTTWHTGGGEGEAAIWTSPLGFTVAGAWALLVALPVLNYWWLRLAWKIGIWTRYLYQISRLRLSLVASHPDQTGGLGFISDVQAKFALVIFAYGISNVAAVIAYKVGIEGASATVPPVWAPAAGFIIGAPLLFTVPLFMFTGQLFETKRRTLAAFREQARRQALAFEARWGGSDAIGAHGRDLPELAVLNNVAAAFTRIEQMRVVPFDLRSATHLVGSTVGSVATALPLLRIEGPITNWLELIAKVLGR
jgi:hypothetical protein